MAEEVLVRQAEALSAQTGQPFGRVLEAVRNTEAGQQLRALAESEYRFQRAAQWQASLRPKRIQERHYSSVESYMERLEGKEQRAHYYALVEEKVEDKERPEHDTRASAPDP